MVRHAGSDASLYEVDVRRRGVERQDLVLHVQGPDKRCKIEDKQ